MSNPNDSEYEIEYSFDGPTAFDVLSSDVRELRQFYQDEKRCRYVFEREIKDKMKIMLEKSEKEIEDKMTIKLENLEIEHRSVENDLRAQIAQLQLKVVDVQKESETAQKVVDLQSELASLKEQNEEAAKKIAELEAQSSSAKASEDAKQEQISALQGSVVTANGENERLTNVLKETEKMLSELQTAVQKAEEEHKNEVTNLAAQKTILESQIEELSASAKSAESLKNQASENEKALEEERESAKKLADQNTKLQKLLQGCYKSLQAEKEKNKACSKITKNKNSFLP